jgi:hypothetical protein
MEETVEKTHPLENTRKEKNNSSIIHEMFILITIYYDFTQLIDTLNEHTVIIFRIIELNTRKPCYNLQTSTDFHI